MKPTDLRATFTSGRAVENSHITLRVENWRCEVNGPSLDDNQLLAVNACLVRALQEAIPTLLIERLARKAEKTEMTFRHNATHPPLQANEPPQYESSRLVDWLRSFVEKNNDA